MSQIASFVILACLNGQPICTAHNAQVVERFNGLDGQCEMMSQLVGWPGEENHKRQVVLKCSSIWPKPTPTGLNGPRHRPEGEERLDEIPDEPTEQNHTPISPQDLERMLRPPRDHAQ
jgi:hypothetical protein